MLREVAAAIEAEEGLTLGGLMAVAPLGTDPRTAFAPLRQLSDRPPLSQLFGHTRLSRHERRSGGRDRVAARHT